MKEEKARSFIPIMNVSKSNDNTVNVRLEFNQNFNKNTTLLEIRNALRESIEKLDFIKDNGVIDKKQENIVVINELAFYAKTFEVESRSKVKKTGKLRLLIF